MGEDEDSLRECKYALGGEGRTSQLWKMGQWGMLWDLKMMVMMMYGLG